jgi:uncharacterized membrane protein
MIWQVAVIATGFISGLAQVVGKKQVGSMSAFQSGLIRDLVTFVIVLAIYLHEANFFIAWESVVIIAIGVLESISIAIYFSAMRSGMAATAIFSYPLSQLLIVLAAAILFGEWTYFDITTSRGVVNILALVLTAILMTVYGGGAKVSKYRWSTALFVSVVITMLGNIQSKWAVSTLGYSAATSMFFEYVGILLGGFIFVYGRGQNLHLGLKAWGWGALQGILFGISALWYVDLLTTSPLGISSLMRRVTIVLVTVLFALLGYREGKNMSRRQILALAMGIIVFAMVMSVNR